MAHALNAGWAIARRLVVEHPFALALAAVLAGYLLPLWRYEFPRMLDFPAHVVMSAQLQEILADPAGSTWRIMPMPWPNLIFPAAVAMLGHVLDLVVAGKVVVSLTVISIPLAMVYLLRRFKVPPWSALVAIPITFGLHVPFGYCPFLSSLPLVILGIALAPTIHSLPRMVGFALLSSLVFFAHVTGFILLGPTATLTALAAARGRRWRTAVLAGLGYAIPAVLLAGRWALAASEMAWELRQAGPATLMPFLPLRRLQEAITYSGWLLDLWEYRTAVVVLLIFLAAVLLPRPAARRAELSRFVPAASVLLIAMLLPTTAGNATLLAERSICVAALLATAWLPLDPTSRPGRIHLAALLLCIGIHAASTWIPAAKFNKQVQQLRLMSRLVPRGSVLVFDTNSHSVGPSKSPTSFDTWQFALAHNYMHLWRGIRSNLFPSAFETSPVQAKPGRLPPLIDRLFISPDQVSSSAAMRVPYLLRLSVRENVPRVGYFERVYRVGYLTLYRNLRLEGFTSALPTVAEACTVQPNSDRTLVYCPQELRWVDAVATCRQWGGRLTDRRPHGGDEPVWVGISNRGRQNGYAYADGRPASFRPTRLEAIADDTRHCLTAHVAAGGWIPTACNDVARVLCVAKPGQRLRPSPEDNVFACGVGRTCTLLSALMPFREAVRACAQRHGDLVRPHDAEASSQIMGMAAVPLWLGYFRRTTATPELLLETNAPWQSRWVTPVNAGFELRGTLCLREGRALQAADCNDLLPFYCERLTPSGRTAASASRGR